METKTTYKRLTNRWGDTIYSSSMEHPSFRYLLDEAIQEIGMERAMIYLEIPADADLSKLVFTGTAFANQTFERVNLTETTFVGCTLNQVRLDTATIRRTRFMGCSLTYVVLPKQTVDYTGLTLNGCWLSSCDFSGVDLRYINFHMCGSHGNNDWTNAIIVPTAHEQVALLLADHANYSDERRIVAAYPTIFRAECYPFFVRMEVTPTIRRWVLETILAHIDQDDYNAPSFLLALRHRKTSDMATPLAGISDNAIDNLIGEYLYETDDDDDDDEDDDEDSDEE